MSILCPLCNSSNSEKAFIKLGYPHYHCRSCQSLYVHPSPSSEELETYYKKESGEKLGSTVCWTDEPDSHRYMWDIWKQSLTLSQQLSGGNGVLMDVGCGAGQFLEFARRLGWQELVGIEWNSEVAKRAEAVSGATIYTSDILKVSFPSESFAVISLWDVIEHLNDVQLVLQEIFRLLKPGGVLLVGTPHCRGLTIRILKEKTLVVNPPEHLVLFSQSGMLKVLKKAGFEIKKQWSFSIYLREWINLFSKLKSEQEVEDKSYVRYRSNLTQSRAFTICMKIANYGLKMTNLGDQLIAIAQKPYS